MCIRDSPGTHPEKGAYFTRGTSHDEYAGYTEDGVKNAEMLSRLLKKFQTASSLDMIMNQSSGFTAYEWLNQAKEKEIAYRIALHRALGGKWVETLIKGD